MDNNNNNNNNNNNDITTKWNEIDKINSLRALTKLLDIDSENKLEEYLNKNPESEEYFDYHGKYKDIFYEYINSFVVTEVLNSKKHDYFNQVNQQLWDECLTIKLFLEWLENDKKAEVVLNE